MWCIERGRLKHLSSLKTELSAHMQLSGTLPGSLSALTALTMLSFSGEPAACARCSSMIARSDVLSRCVSTENNLQGSLPDREWARGGRLRALPCCTCLASTAPSPLSCRPAAAAKNGHLTQSAHGATPLSAALPALAAPAVSDFKAVALVAITEGLTGLAET